MIAADMMGSGQGVENEHCIGVVLIKSSPSCVGKLGRRNASAVTKGEIPKRNLWGFWATNQAVEGELYSLPNRPKEPRVLSLSAGGWSAVYTISTLFYFRVPIARKVDLLAV